MQGIDLKAVQRYMSTIVEVTDGQLTNWLRVRRKERREELSAEEAAAAAAKSGAAEAVASPSQLTAEPQQPLSEPGDAAMSGGAELPAGFTFTISKLVRCTGCNAHTCLTYACQKL